jgi:hypothetical protein
MRSFMISSGLLFAGLSSKEAMQQAQNEIKAFEFEQQQEQLNSDDGFGLKAGGIAVASGRLSAEGNGGETDVTYSDGSDSDP